MASLNEHHHFNVILFFLYTNKHLKFIHNFLLGVKCPQLRNMTSESLPFPAIFAF